MITIRDAQLPVLSPEFLEPLVRFVRDNVPEVHASAGEAGVLELAREATTRAARYGIVRCRDVGRYVAFMVGLGWNFDTDPRYPWAGAILRHRALTSEQKLAELLAVVASHSR